MYINYVHELLPLPSIYLFSVTSRPVGQACNNRCDFLRRNTHTTQPSSHPRVDNTLDFHNPKPKSHMQSIQDQEYNNNTEEAIILKPDNRVQ